MTTLINKKGISTQFLLSKEGEAEIIIQHWIRILKVRLIWIRDLEKLIINYVMHKDYVWSIDYSTFDDRQLICSGSSDKTVRVWDVETNKQIRLFNQHSSYVYCAKFSPYHYHKHHRNVICSSSWDKTIRLWDFKRNQQLKIFNGHTSYVVGIDFSRFNGGRYVCSGSFDKTVCLWDVETSKSLHIFNGHTNTVWCVDFSSLQSNNKDDNNKSNSIGFIGGNGYTICSGSLDKTIRIWDIETTKQLILLNKHKAAVRCVKYGSNELGISDGANAILSGSDDKSVCLWDIRSGQQIQVFNRHRHWVMTVEYSPFVVNNNKVGGSSNVICSGSTDNIIRFWDIRSNKKKLYAINGDKQDCGIYCLKFLQLKKKNKSACDISLCYGSRKGRISIWG
ncbi:hypothetical protein RFI_15259 [Reticulomyxa filosa]|uniref:Uncharacterized protein n=1 Tax=Reticulomyxa filosa TaxID=46433 RepID=X6N7F4_RETFI|nr:hypothetical protein RFI_15259 [Reticulomyxa filosa]|eukprot:ETO21946.1 hypothetical protein RFI_15259 [Reticulomyxa filosa]